LNEKMNSRILRILPREKAFYFFTSIGNYTGESATSLKEFTDKINEINAKSLEFHFYRGDFEKWTAEVLEDKELAEQIGTLRKMSPIGEKLKNGLHRILTRRYSRLRSNL
jgi:hypothetical protein